MALINCPECEKQEISVTEGAICPSCGFKVSEKFLLNEDRKSWSQIRWFFVGLFSLIICVAFGVIFSLANSYLGILASSLFLIFASRIIKSHELLNTLNKKIFISLIIIFSFFLIIINLTELIK